MYQYLRPLLVEARGIEPLSENSGLQVSPSAGRVLKFPLTNAPCRAFAVGSFMIPASSQSFDAPVPHINDAEGLSRERLRSTRCIKQRKQIRYCQFDLIPRFYAVRVRGSLLICPTIPVETSTPP